MAAAVQEKNPSDRERYVKSESIFPIGFHFGFDFVFMLLVGFAYIQPI